MASSAVEPLWSVAEAASYLGVPEWTLRKWISQNTGPRSYRVGRYRKYKREDVDRWLEGQASDKSKGSVA